MHIDKRSNKIINENIRYKLKKYTDFLHLNYIN